MFYELHPYVLKKHVRELEKAKSEITERVMIYFALSVSASLAVALVLAETFQKRISDIIDEISTATQKMAIGQEIKIKNGSFSVEFEKLVKSIEKLSERLRERSFVRKSVTSSVYHELMTPLSVIRMQLEALKDGVIEYNEALPLNMIENIEHISKVLKDIKNIEGGEVKYAREKFNLASACEESCKTFENIFSARNVNFSCSLNDVHLFCDEQRFKQVIFNLLSNALKYTPNGGKVVLNLDAKALIISNTSKVNQKKIEFGEGLNFVKRFCEFYAWKFEIRALDDRVEASIMFS